MRAVEVLRKVVETGAALRARRAEGEPLVSLDAGLRVVEATTELTRRARAGPLPPARGLERVALTAAQAQLRLMAGLLGVSVQAAEPVAAPRDDARALPSEGFVSPRDRALAREQTEARVQAALGAMVAEAIALVDAVLEAPREFAPGAAGRALGGGRPPDGAG